MFFRLRHHLDPMAFSPWAYLGYAVLTVFWLWARRRAVLDRRERFFARFVIGSVIIAAAGFLLGVRGGDLEQPPLPEDMPWMVPRAKLLRFYEFRLFDAVLPMAVAAVIVGLAHRWRIRLAVSSNQGVARAFCWLTFGGAMLLALLLPGADRNPSLMPAERRQDWLRTCAWIRHHTPQDALFLAPRERWAFKWYAQRPEYVAFKDCPQDPAGIDEWNDRLNFVQRWAETHHDEQRGYSPQAIRRLQEATGIEYLVTDHLG
ncbi:MAG: DUF6798 domain-containing protein, partial [Candidatus Acidiferrales bacterium]